MKLSQQPVVEPIGFNMTPMIDVVFLLIIFFMTVSQLNQNVLPPMQLPFANFADSAERTTMGSALVLNLDSQGQLRVNQEVIKRDELDDFLQRSLVHLNADGRTPHAKLRCAADCSTSDVNFVFDRLSESGFQSVTVAVRNRQ